MDPMLIQGLRYKLQRRVSRLNSVDGELFTPTLKQFWPFVDRQPLLAGVLATLLANYPEIEDTTSSIFDGDGVHGETETEAAAIGYGVLRRGTLSDDYDWILNLGMHYGRMSTLREALEVVRDVFLVPLYEWLDEQLDDQRAMLAIIYRYKHRSEWFHSQRLWTMVQDSDRDAEKRLAIDLYSFLYDQGIDFMLEPESLRGKIDLIASQGTNDPLLLDAKVFDGKDRNIRYIRKGFRQIYSYTQQHNEAFGYLVIFNTTEQGLRFSLSAGGNIPVLTCNHKTIFLVTVDIHPHEKPVSQRSPMIPFTIMEEDLIGSLTELVEPAELGQGDL